MRTFLLIFCFYASNALAQSLTQTVRGIVVDKVLRTPIPGAQVVLLQVSPTKGAVTDKNGEFRIQQVPTGRYDVQASFVGFETVVLTNVQVISSKEAVLSFELQEDVTVLSEVVVTADNLTPLNEQLIGSTQLIRPEEVNRFAGARQDPARMASNYAGVVGGGDQRNDVIIRGNSPNGVLWRLDDLDIPAPNHFSVAGNPGGVFSILNNNLLSSSDFTTGAFPAEYGNRTAGVFDLRLRKGNNEKREHTFQAGLNGLEFGTEGPVGFRGGSYLVNGRYFYTGILEALGADLGAAGVPKFWDGAFKLHLPLKNNNSLSIWAMGGNSRLDNRESSEDKSEWDSNPVEDDNFGSHMFSSGLSITQNYSRRTVGKFTFGFTGSGSDNEKRLAYLNDSLSIAERLDFSEKNISFRYQVDHKVGKGMSLHSGIEHKRISYSYQMRERDEGDPEFEYPLNEQNTEPFHSMVFTSINWRPTEKWTMVGGLFAQLVHLNNTYAVEPRLAVSYNARPTDRFHLSYGKHSQTHPFLYYRWRSVDAQGTAQQTNLDLDLTRAHHLVAGYEKSLGDNWLLKSEIYYQYLFDLPVSSDPNEPYYSYANLGADFSFKARPNVVNDGKGVNKGFEVTVERFLDHDYYLLFTGSIFDSKFRNADGTWYNTAFNSNYVTNLLAGKEWTLNPDKNTSLSVDVRLTYTGNRRYIPIDLARSNESGEKVLDADRAFLDRYPDYFRADIKVTYMINKPKATHQVFIAADNVTNYKNVYYQDYNRKTGSIKTYQQFGLFPYLAYRVNF